MDQIENLFESIKKIEFRLDPLGNTIKKYHGIIKGDYDNEQTTEKETRKEKLEKDSR